MRPSEFWSLATPVLLMGLIVGMVGGMAIERKVITDHLDDWGYVKVEKK